MTTKKIVPSEFQPPLPLNELIVECPTEHDEQVPMDVLFVGAGPAGLAGAIRLAQLVKEDEEKGGGLGPLEIGVLEKAGSLGGHSLSGAVLNPVALRELFPELKDEDLPFRNRVTKDQVYYLTDKGQVRLPTPPTMHNQGNYTASLCEVVRWMGEKAENLGVNILTGFPADALMVKDQRVKGVRTTPAGLNKDRSQSSQFMPPTEVVADVTVLTEGTRGTLTQAYLEWQKLASASPQIYALGVKELWRVPAEKQLQAVTHTMGWPLPKTDFGGSFMYPMGKDLISLGLVVGLDYREHNLDIHYLLQKLKAHPFFHQALEGGELVEWGAKTIPEGGLNALPERLYGDGLLIAGDSAGFVNVPALKGIHYAMKSGILAAESVFAALKSKDTSCQGLATYGTKIQKSYIHQDLYKVRHMRHAFKSGFLSGAMKAGLMTLSGGAFPGGGQHHLEDAQEWKSVENQSLSPATGLSKVDGVYQSSNKTRDDIPSHLTVGKDFSADVAEMYVHMCPAGVYEREGDQLVVNAPNCVDCKATDILGPRWRPREGGSGPNYNEM